MLRVETVTSKPFFHEPFKKKRFLMLVITRATLVMGWPLRIFLQDALQLSYIFGECLNTFLALINLRAILHPEIRNVPDFSISRCI